MLAGSINSHGLAGQFLAAIAVDDLFVGAGVGAASSNSVFLNSSLRLAVADGVNILYTLGVLSLISQEVGAFALCLVVSGVEANKLAAIDDDGGIASLIAVIVAVQSPGGSLCLEAAAIDDDHAAILDVDQVEVVGILAVSAHIGVSTAVDGDLTAISEDSDIPLIAADTVDDAFAIDGQVAASNNMEHAVTCGVLLGSLDIEAVQVQNDSLVDQDSSVNIRIGQQSDLAACLCCINSSCEGCIVSVADLCLNSLVAVIGVTDDCGCTGDILDGNIGNGGNVAPAAGHDTNTASAVQNHILDSTGVQGLLANNTGDAAHHGGTVNVNILSSKVGVVSSQTAVHLDISDHAAHNTAAGDGRAIGCGQGQVACVGATAGICNHAGSVVATHNVDIAHNGDVIQSGVVGISNSRSHDMTAGIDGHILNNQILNNVLGSLGSFSNAEEAGISIAVGVQGRERDGQVQDFEAITIEVAHEAVVGIDRTNTDPVLAAHVDISSQSKPYASGVVLGIICIHLVTEEDQVFQAGDQVGILLSAFACQGITLNQAVSAVLVSDFVAIHGGGNIAALGSGQGCGSGGQNDGAVVGQSAGDLDSTGNVHSALSGDLEALGGFEGRGLIDVHHSDTLMAQTHAVMVAHNQLGIVVQSHDDSSIHTGLGLGSGTAANTEAVLHGQGSVVQSDIALSKHVIQHDGGIIDDQGAIILVGSVLLTAGNIDAVSSVVGSSGQVSVLENESAVANAAAANEQPALAPVDFGSTGDGDGLAAHSASHSDGSIALSPNQGDDCAILGCIDSISQGLELLFADLSDEGLSVGILSAALGAGAVHEVVVGHFRCAADIAVVIVVAIGIGALADGLAADIALVIIGLVEAGGSSLAAVGANVSALSSFVNALVNFAGLIVTCVVAVVVLADMLDSLLEGLAVHLGAATSAVLDLIVSSVSFVFNHDFAADMATQTGNLLSSLQDLTAGFAAKALGVTLLLTGRLGSSNNLLIVLPLNGFTLTDLGFAVGAPDISFVAILLLIAVHCNRIAELGVLVSAEVGIHSGATGALAGGLVKIMIQSLGGSAGSSLSAAIDTVGVAGVAGVGAISLNNTANLSGGVLASSTASGELYGQSQCTSNSSPLAGIVNSNAKHDFCALSYFRSSRLSIRNGDVALASALRIVHCVPLSSAGSNRHIEGTIGRSSKMVVHHFGNFQSVNTLENFDGIILVVASCHRHDLVIHVAVIGHGRISCHRCVGQNHTQNQQH